MTGSNNFTNLSIKVVLLSYLVELTRSLGAIFKLNLSPGAFITQSYCLSSLRESSLRGFCYIKVRTQSISSTQTFSLRLSRQQLDRAWILVWAPLWRWTHLPRQPNKALISVWSPLWKWLG